MGYLRRATLKDAVDLGPRLRDEDKREIYAHSGLDPVTALLMSIDNSEFPVAMVDEDEGVIGIFGVVPMEPEISSGKIWMLCSETLVQKYKIRFIRECRNWLNILGERYNLLYNVVDKRNGVHIRWLRFCGFTFIQSYNEYGFEKRPFLEFVRINK